MTQATIDFVEQHLTCFDRSLLSGHVTGSAWIVSPDRQQTLLIHHRKLDRWLQPGGHADGDPDVAAVALREAQEETGLTTLIIVVTPGGGDNAKAEISQTVPIFDVDIHPIPARNEVPEHLHYDIRFLVEADPTEPLGFSEEIRDIRWFSRSDAATITGSESVLRLIRKMKSP
jgi:8-oxo-dGTP pyrophosphatase MutT (NUDIX family)